MDSTLGSTTTSPVAAALDASAAPVIAAAGALPWRRRDDRLEVALVHRPRYDDWSWSKGKLDPGEDWPVAAVREVREETGLLVRLGRPLPSASYLVLDRSGEPATKSIRYWAAEVVGGDGRLEHEIDEVRWLEVAAASDRLTYARDRDQLRGLVRADLEGQLQTWPLVVLRHAHARPRGSWSRPDALRPLDSRGRERATALAGLLSAYAAERILSSPSVRCTQTVAPYATAARYQVRERNGLSEEGYEQDPDRPVRHLHRLLARGTPAILCTHGALLPRLLGQLSEVAVGEAAEELRSAASTGMSKGEALVAHMSGTGEGATVVAVERHQP